MSRTGKEAGSLMKLFLKISCNPFGLRLVLSLYAFIIFVIVEVVTVLHNGHDLLTKERDIIIIIGLISIELINQITYWLAKNNRNFAAGLKCVLFWFIFTMGAVVFLYLLVGLDRNVVLRQYEEIGRIMAYLLLSLSLPYYSLSPEFRFLLLRGKFKT